MIRGEVLAFLLLPAWVAVPHTGEPLTPAELRGQQIYLKGTSPGENDIVAAFGKDAVKVPASVMPCVNCHGHDGVGRPEGGVVPSNITWESLTKPYGIRRADGREAPPYTERGLKKAIAMGLDPAGNRLNNTMPRFALTLGDMADLIAYLKQVGRHVDPGLENTLIRIGVVLPPEKPLARMGQVVAAVLRARVAQINNAGGLYSRRLELHFSNGATEPDRREDAFRGLIDTVEPFVMLASFIAGDEPDIADLLQKERLPLIGAFTLNPRIRFPLNRHVFYIESGFSEQGRALIHFAATQFGAKRPRLALIFPEIPEQREIARLLAQQCATLGWQDVVEASLNETSPAILAQQLRDQGNEIVLFLGAGPQAVSFLKQAQNLSWSPLFLIPGSRVDKQFFDLPAGVRVHMALPVLPMEKMTRELQDYQQLAASAGLSDEFFNSQTMALTSLKLLVEGLSRVGRDLSREKLIEALEGLYRFPTGLSPALTFGPNRRVGSRGAFVLRLDLQQRAWVNVSDWIELNKP